MSIVSQSTAKTLISDFNNVKLGQEQEELVYRWLRNNSSGLILVTGCVDELLNTTCLAILEKVSSIYPSAKMITLEYALKYTVPFALQIKVEENTSYRDYMPSVLRHNADVFYIEKIQTQEDADVVSRLVDLGYLVISSVSISTTNHNQFESICNLNTLRISTSQISSTLA